MKASLFAAFLLASALAAPAVARQPVPIVNHDNIPVVINSGKASAEQVKQAIVAAATSKGWSVTPLADGKLQASLVVRDKHTVIVTVTYSADSYSLNYKDSNNMNYEKREGEPVIHPYYNKWVQDLKTAINIALLKA